MDAVVRAARTTLIDAICMTDESLLSQRMDGREPDPASLRAALRRATVAGKLVPVVCGSARDRIGMQPLLDAIVDYLPSPLEAPPVVGYVPRRAGAGAPLSTGSSTDPDADEMVESPGTPGAPLCASAFKIVVDPHVGHLTWVRVFSGRIDTGGLVYIPRVDLEERVGRIYRMHANRREQAQTMGPGDVMAVVGLKSAATGDTLCDRTHPIALEPFTFPEPVITVALTPAPRQEDAVHRGIARLCSEDPTLVASYDAETQEGLLSGMGELQLEVAVDRLRTEYGVEAKVGLPRVAYRETVRRKAVGAGTYRQQTGGHGHFAVVRLRIEPLQRGRGILFENRVSAAELPEQFLRPAEAGAREALQKGVIAGFPVTDVRVTWLGGRYHAVDSGSMDFRIAGSMAVREAVRLASPTLLEPVMCADISVGEEYMGAVAADLARRRGSVSSIQAHGRTRAIVGEVPLAEVRGYATDLRSLTQGRCAFTLEFRRYELVPGPAAARVIRERVSEGKVSAR
jgi:elongation factor G